MKSFEVHYYSDRTGAPCCFVTRPDGTRTEAIQLGPLGRISIRTILDLVEPGSWEWLEPDPLARRDGR